MKPIKLKSLIFAGVIVIITAILISVIVNPRPPRLQKSSVPAKAEKAVSKPIQPSEPIASEKPLTAKPEKPNQLSKPASKTDKVVKQVIPAQTAPMAETAMPAESAAVPMETAPEPVAQEQTGLRTNTGWSRTLDNFYDKMVMPEELRPPALNAAENQHHRQVFTRIKPYLQTPVSNYSKEKIEKLNSVFIEKLPANYSKMLINLEELKKQELANRQMQQMRFSSPRRTDVNSVSLSE